MDTCYRYRFMPRQGMHVRTPYPCADSEQGTGDVPIERHFEFATVFITAPKDGELVPKGTGFLVRFKGASGNWWLYVVTARHVIAGIEDQAHVRLRICDKDAVWLEGTAPLSVVGTKDVPCGPWSPHPERPVDEDVAVAPLSGLHAIEGVEEGSWQFAAVALPLFDSPIRREPYMLGDPIYYVGLLEKPGALGKRAQPVVRSGTLAAWRQTGVSLRLADGTLRKPREAHLVDVRTWTGFSGSPCMIQWNRYEHGSWTKDPVGEFISRLESLVRVNDPDAWRENNRALKRKLDELVRGVTDLFGVFVGFIGDFRPTETREDVRLTVPIWETLGIGVVIPIERVIETLQRPELVEERQMRQSDAWEQQDKEDDGAYFVEASSDDARPGPDPERLKLDGSLEDVAKRVMDAGKPEDEDDGD